MSLETLIIVSVVNPVLVSCRVLYSFLVKIYTFLETRYVAHNVHQFAV